MDDRVGQDENGEGGHNHEEEGPADIAQSSSGNSPAVIRVAHKVLLCERGRPLYIGRLAGEFEHRCSESWRKGARA